MNIYYQKGLNSLSSYSAFLFGDNLFPTLSREKRIVAIVTGIFILIGAYLLYRHFWSGDEKKVKKIDGSDLENKTKIDAINRKKDKSPASNKAGKAEDKGAGNGAKLAASNDEQANQELIASRVAGDVYAQDQAKAKAKTAEKAEKAAKGGKEDVKVDSPSKPNADKETPGPNVAKDKNEIQNPPQSKKDEGKEAAYAKFEAMNKKAAREAAKNQKREQPKTEAPKPIAPADDVD